MDDARTPRALLVELMESLRSESDALAANDILRLAAAVRRRDRLLHRLAPHSAELRADPSYTPLIRKAVRLNARATALLELRRATNHGRLPLRLDRGE